MDFVDRRDAAAQRFGDDEDALVIDAREVLLDAGVVPRVHLFHVKTVDTDFERAHGFEQSALEIAADACNADVVVEATPSTSHITSPIDSWRTFYSQDVRSTGGLPADGKLVSASKVAYQLGHYAKNNVVAMTSNDQHRINFAQPVAANTVYLLATSTAGASTLGVVLNYEDGTSSEESIVSVRDWSVPDLQGDEAYTGLGFISIENEELSDRFRYCLFENAIAANPLKKLAGLTLIHTVGSIVAESNASFPTLHR